MAGLDQLDTPQVTGGLDLMPEAEPDLEYAVAKLRAQSSFLQPDQVSQFSRRLNPPPMRTIEYEKQLKDAIDRSRQASINAQQWMMNPPINTGLPWLRFGAGMLSPTLTGSGAESLGKGVSGLAEGLEEQQKQRLALGQAGMKTGVEAEQNAFNDYSKLSGLAETARRNDVMLEKARQAMMITKDIQNFAFGHGLSIEDVLAGNIPPELRPEFAELQRRAKMTAQEKNATSLSGTSTFFKSPEMQDQVRMMIEGPIKNRALNAVKAQMAGMVFNTKAEYDAEFNKRMGAVNNYLGLDPSGKLKNTAAAGDVASQISSDPTLIDRLASGESLPAPTGGDTSGTQPYMKGSPEYERQREYSEGLGKEQGKYEDELAETAKTAATGNRALAELEEAIKKGTPGALAFPAAMLSKLRIAAGVGTDADVQRAKEFETGNKVVGMLATNAAKNISSRPSQLEFLKILEEYVPNMSMTPEGALKMIRLMRQSNNLGPMEADAYWKWRRENPRGNFRDFQQNFIRTIPSLPLEADEPAGGHASIPGLPAGSKLIGYTKDKKFDIYQDPDGGKHQVPR